MLLTDDGQMTRLGHLRHDLCGKAVRLGSIHQQVKGVQAAEHLVVGPVQVSPGRTRGVERFDPGGAVTRSSSIGPNWIDAVGQAWAQAGTRPLLSRS